MAVNTILVAAIAVFIIYFCDLAYGKVESESVSADIHHKVALFMSNQVSALNIISSIGNTKLVTVPVEVSN